MYASARPPNPCARWTIIIFCALVICWSVAQAGRTAAHANGRRNHDLDVTFGVLSGISGVARCIIGLIGAIKYNVCMLLVFFWWTVIGLIIFFILAVVVFALIPAYVVAIIVLFVLFSIFDIIIAILTWSLKEDIKSSGQGGGGAVVV